MKKRGFWVVTILGWVFLMPLGMVLGWAPWVIGLVVTATIALDVWNWWLVRQQTQAVAYMWQLATQLGYDEVKLQTLMPQYGIVDLKLTRPEFGQFVPSGSAVRSATAALEQALMQPRHPASQD